MIYPSIVRYYIVVFELSIIMIIITNGEVDAPVLFSKVNFMVPVFCSRNISLYSILASLII